MSSFILVNLIFSYMKSARGALICTISTSMTFKTHIIRSVIIRRLIIYSYFPFIFFIIIFTTFRILRLNYSECMGCEYF